MCFLALAQCPQQHSMMNSALERAMPTSLEARGTPVACGEGKRELIESAREFPKDFRPASPGGVAPEVRKRIAAQVTPYGSKCFKLRGCYTRNASGEFYYSSNVRNRAAYRDLVTPTRSQYFTNLQRLQNGEIGWQIF